jgi:hypothetical protein
MVLAVRASLRRGRGRSTASRYVVRATVTPWNDYHTRRASLLAVIVGVIPAEAVIGLPLGRLLHSDVPFLVIAFASLTLFLFAHLRLCNFRCPSCGKRFFMRSLSVNLFARRCMHCDFPKWGADEAAGPPQRTT